MLHTPPVGASATKREEEMSGATTTIAPPGRRPPRQPAGPAVDEHDLYPVHEEDNVPEKPLHELVAGYLKDALRAHLPGKWVTGDVCMYWERGNMRKYAAPDVLVVDAPAPDPLPPVYLKWLDPPSLLVAEVGSKSTFLKDEGPKPAIYEQLLEVPEYLYYHPDRHELRLYRRQAGGYREVLPDARGRVHSEGLDVWFGVDAADWLRVYTPDGEMLLTHEESERARREAEARVREETEARAAMARRVAELEERLRRLGEDPGGA